MHLTMPLSCCAYAITYSAPKASTWLPTSTYTTLEIPSGSEGPEKHLTSNRLEDLVAGAEETRLYRIVAAMTTHHVASTARTTSSATWLLNQPLKTPFL